MLTKVLSKLKTSFLIKFCLKVSPRVNKQSLFTLPLTLLELGVRDFCETENFIKNEVFNLGFRETETWLRSKITPRNQAINIVGTLDKIFRARLKTFVFLPKETVI
jgi:hypothetical protein